MTDTISKTLPHWDMTPLFPALDSKEFTTAFDDASRLIGELRQIFDDRSIRKTSEQRIEDETIALFEDVLNRLNDLGDRLREIRGYLHAFITTEAQNDVAQARYSELQIQSVVLEKLEKRFSAWIGSLDAVELVERSSLAREHAFFLRKATETSEHLMGEAEEDLASSLSPSGQSAWAKLHGNVTSRVMVDLTKPDGSVERLPMASVAGLTYDADPAMREAGYRAAMAAWPAVEVPLAAALNGIKGWNNEVDSRRGWPDALEPALFANNVDRATLEAMQQACIESFPDFHGYLRTKARLLGKDKIPWFDLSAPLGAVGKRWEWSDTESFIVEQFGTYSDKLAALADRAFRERWIDAEPREGKRSGGFCMGVRPAESRILVNYTHAFMDVATVAHELGHAYHNVNLAERSAYQRRTPMALAETASTFCETIVTRAMFAAAAPDEQLGILNGDLVRDMQIVVVIHSRFLFEQRLCEARRKRELSAAELCRMMSEAQLEVLGDAIDPDALHPYMWCVSPHYYGLPFYNWPYTFGLLFGLGLYKRYETDPDGFRAGYDELLSSTGADDAATLCARFGIDVRSPDFWRASLDVIRERIADFSKLAG
jgi:pepF/M3 family oligoendopeptidase